MTRSNKIRQVYKELRDTLGEDISSLEALNSSEALVKLFDDTDDSGFVYFSDARPTFDELPVDTQMARSDVDWRFMKRERNLVSSVFPEDHQDQLVARQLKYYGLETNA